MLSLLFALHTGLTASHAVTGPELLDRARAVGHHAVEGSVDYRLLIAAVRNEDLPYAALTLATNVRNIHKALVTRGDRNAHLRRRLRHETRALADIEELRTARDSRPFTLPERIAAMSALTHYVAHASWRDRDAIEALAFAESADGRTHGARESVEFLRAYLDALDVVRLGLRFWLMGPLLETLERRILDVQDAVARNDDPRAAADFETLQLRADRTREMYLTSRPIGARCMKMLAPVLNPH